MKTYHNYFIIKNKIVTTMYVITKKTESGKLNIFYEFSTDEGDLFFSSDDLETCKKYTKEEKERLENNDLLFSKKVKFQKIRFVLDNN